MPGDASYSNVKLLLHGDGVNGGTTFTDNSPAPRTPSSVGACTTSTMQSKYGGSSIRFPQNSPLVYASSADFNLNITSWTWEMWYYEESGSSASLVSRRESATANGWVLTANGLRALVNGAGFEGQMTWARPSLDAWHHIAWCKSGTSMYVGIDGVIVATKTGVTSLSDAGGNLNFGQADQASEARFKGYMDDIRFTSGVARYTADYTPPARAHLDGSVGVAGVIRDDTGTPCARTVRLYNRGTGVLVASGVSDAATGEYLLTVPTADEVHRVVLDDLAGTLYNDLIDRVIPA